MMNPEQTALALEAAMDALRNDLVEGRIKNLPLHLEQIEQLLPRLSALTDRKLMERLRDNAQRNEACLAAARRGVQAARQRLADLLAASRGFSTYDGKGRRAPIEAMGQNLAQRI